MAAGEQGFINGLPGDDEIADQFCDAAQFASFARFECALMTGLAEARRIEAEPAQHIAAQISSFEPDTNTIAQTTIRDGVPVPDYIRQLRAHVSGPGSEMLHFGATSQDLIDTATVEALSRCTTIMTKRLERVLEDLDQLRSRDGNNVLQAITRMQPALRFHASDRIAAWRHPLQALLDRVQALREQTEILQFGGAVGDLQSLGEDAETIAKTMADQLRLTWPGRSWHTARAPILAHAGWLVELSTSLGKIGQDVTLMALRGTSDIKLSGGGTSSAMPHKQNPIGAERLVAMARLNAGLMATMHQSQLHEMERSGSAWMLEGMVLPQICETTGAALDATSQLVQSINRMGTPP